MDKSKELKTITNIVREILENFKMARNSDMILYLKVCEKVSPEALNEEFWHVLANMKDYHLPNFETVRRTRQKLQASFPELAADSDVEAQRILNEEVFRDYARGIV